MGKKQRSPTKTTKRSPWPRGWAGLIHPKNNPLSDLPDSHPAKLLLFAQGQFRLDCVGKEIPWPGHEDEAFDQEWQSQLLGRVFRFSSFAYCIYYDLILEEWLTHPPYVTESEKWMLARIQCLDALLDECEHAAKNDENTRVLARVAQTRELNQLHMRAMSERWATDQLNPPDIPVVNDVKKTLGWWR
jgi:hypothetical protein